MRTLRAIPGYGKIEKLLGRVPISTFRILRELHFVEVDGHHQVSMLLECDAPCASCRALFLFGEVTDFEIKGVGGGQARIIGLDIVNIEERHWESASWEVVDYENQSIHFYAKTVAIGDVTCEEQPRGT